MSKVKLERPASADTSADAAKKPASSVRDRLIQATLRQIRANGLASVTARSICSEVGVAAPTLYHYFGDLQGLYQRVLGSIFESGNPSHPDEQEDPEAVIHYVWDTMLHLAEHDPHVIDLFNQLLSSGSIPDVMQQNYERLETAFDRATQNRLTRIDPKLSAEIYWAAVLGMSTLVTAAQHGVPYPTGAADLLRHALLDRIFGNPSYER